MAGCPTFLAKKQGAGLFPVGSTDRVGNQKAKGGKVYSHPTFSSALSYQTKFTFPNLLFHPLRIKVKSNVSWEGGCKKIQEWFHIWLFYGVNEKVMTLKEKEFYTPTVIGCTWDTVLPSKIWFDMILLVWFGLIWYYCWSQCWAQ